MQIYYTRPVMDNGNVNIYLFNPFYQVHYTFDFSNSLIAWQVHMFKKVLEF